MICITFINFQRNKSQDITTQYTYLFLKIMNCDLDIAQKQGLCAKSISKSNICLREKWLDSSCRSRCKVTLSICWLAVCYRWQCLESSCDCQMHLPLAVILMHAANSQNHISRHCVRSCLKFDSVHLLPCSITCKKQSQQAYRYIH